MAMPHSLSTTALALTVFYISSPSSPPHARAFTVLSSQARELPLMSSLSLCPLPCPLSGSEHQLCFPSLVSTFPRLGHMRPCARHPLQLLHSLDNLFLPLLSTLPTDLHIAIRFLLTNLPSSLRSPPPRTHHNKPTHALYSPARLPLPHMPLHLRSPSPRSARPPHFLLLSVPL